MVIVYKIRKQNQGLWDVVDLYDLPRKEEEKFINDYNPAILLAWEGSMDLWCCGEKSKLITWYLNKYETKAEIHEWDSRH